MKKAGRKSFLAIIPARGGSKRIPNKNIKIFNGKPLIYYAIKQAQESGIFDKIIVDTDSEAIARVAKKYGAEVPFLRPPELAADTAKIGDAIEYLLKKLANEQGYNPENIALLQTTSPLRTVEDIKACYEVMRNPKVVSLCTVCDTSPWFYHMSPQNKLILVNKTANKSTNTQEVPRGYVLNGCMVYMIGTKRFLKTKKFVDEETVGVVCPKWRSVDLDYPEDWVLAEFLHKNISTLEKKLEKF